METIVQIKRIVARVRGGVISLFSDFWLTVDHGVRPTVGIGVPNVEVSHGMTLLV